MCGRRPAPPRSESAPPRVCPAPSLTSPRRGASPRPAAVPEWRRVRSGRRPRAPGGSQAGARSDWSTAAARPGGAAHPGPARAVPRAGPRPNAPPRSPHSRGRARSARRARGSGVPAASPRRTFRALAQRNGMLAGIFCCNLVRLGPGFRPIGCTELNWPLPMMRSGRGTRRASNSNPLTCFRARRPKTACAPEFLDAYL